MTGRRKSARASAERGKQARNAEETVRNARENRDRNTEETVRNARENRDRNTEETVRNARENQPAVSVRRLQLPHHDYRVSDAAKRERNAEGKERRAKENQEENQEPNANGKQARNQAPNPEEKQARSAEENPETSGEKKEGNAEKQEPSCAEKHEASVEKHEASVEKHEASVEKHEASVEKHEASVEKHEASVEKHEASAEDLETRPEELEASAEDLEERVEELKARAEDLETRPEELEASAEELEASAEDLEASTEELEARVEDLEASAEELEASAEDPEASTEDLEASAEELEASAEDLEESAEELEASAEDLEESAEELEASAEDLEASTEELEASAEDLEASAEDLEASAEELEASAEDLEASTEELEASAEDLEASAEDLEASAEDLEASVEDLEASAEELEASTEDLEASTEELEASTEDLDSGSSQKELSESSESDETSVQSRADVSDDADEKENGDSFPSEEKENQCPDALGDGAAPKEYRCKYCAFTTLHLGDFKEHVDSAHPDVILNPLYLCVACSFTTKKFESLTAHNEERHPCHASFSFRKSRSGERTVLEQTIDGSDGVLPSANGVHALSVNGTVILPDASALHDSSHVSPMLQRPPNFSCVPQVAVPLNTTKYNPTLDDNATLIASFSRFPYPTHAELSWLTAASKHPEEQIRVWFTTQRLKQGITWSPEEVEEARKKMFNGSVRHATLPVSRATARTTTVEPPKQASPRNALKRTSAASFGPEPKRPVMAVAPNPGEKGLMAPPPLPLKPTLDAKRAPVPLAPLMLQKPSPNSLKTWPIVPMPSMVFPESLTRRTITPAPFYSPQFKSNVLVSRTSDKTPISLPNGTLPASAPLIPPQIRRPAVIQALRGNAEQNEPLDPKSDFQQRAQVLTQFPLLERLKGKTAEQLKLLEESFLRNSFPTLSDVETLAAATRLSPAEVDSWFSERRALRDNLEQALLNSMGSRRNGPGHAPNGHAHNGHAPNALNSHNGHALNSHNGHALNSHNGHALNSHNGHALNSHNGHAPNGQAHNGHSLNGHNGHTPNGFSSHAPNGHAPNGHAPNGHAPNAPGPVEKMLQNGVHRAAPSRGPEELAASRWSFVDDLTQRWFNADISGKTGSVLQSPELMSSRCLDSTNGRAQEAEPSWFKPPYERYNRMDLGPMFGRWTDRRQDLSEES